MRSALYGTARASPFSQLQQSSSACSLGLCSGKGWGFWKGLLLELSPLPCVCSHSNQSCSSVESTAGSQDVSEPCSSHEEAPSFEAGVHAGTPLGQPQAHLAAQMCLKDKKEQCFANPKPGPAGPAWTAGLSGSTLDSSQLQGGVLPALGVSCLAFRRAWNTFGSTPFWVCHMFAFPALLSTPASTKEKQDQHTLPARRPLARAKHSSGIKSISRA